METVKKNKLTLIKDIFLILLKIFIFFVFVIFATFRMYNIITMIVGVLFIFLDKTLFGRIIGWLLASASLIATILFFLIYSVEGGMMF